MPKGITRIENYKRRADGWWVRLQRQGRKFSKFFKDSDFASKDAAFEAAQTFYNQLAAEHPKATPQEHAERKTARTGEIIGVRRLLKIDERWNGSIYEVWEAKWSHGKKRQRVKTFSIEKYGEQEAKRLAIEARLEGLAQMSER